MIERLDYIEINPKAVTGLASVKSHVGTIDARLQALVELLVSLINGCAYCIDLHATQARDLGETQQRIDCLTVWRECKFFDDTEAAAFAWAEALTNLKETHAPDHIYDGLKAHYSDQQIVDLTMIIATMNAWNRIAVGFRHLPEETR